MCESTVEEEVGVGHRGARGGKRETGDGRGEVGGRWEERRAARKPADTARPIPPPTTQVSALDDRKYMCTPLCRVSRAFRPLSCSVVSCLYLASKILCRFVFCGQRLHNVLYIGGDKTTLALPIRGSNVFSV